MEIHRHQEDSAPDGPALRPAQVLEDWTGVYDGLSENEVEEIDKVARS